MTKLNGIEDNGDEMKEMKGTHHRSHTSINTTTCFSQVSRHDDSAKIEEPKQLQNHHHHHRHHKHKPQQQQQQQAWIHQIDTFFLTVGKHCCTKSKAF
jgi:hypothetical protein